MNPAVPALRAAGDPAAPLTGRAPARPRRTPNAMPADSHPRLLGDIGGTNARFAWQASAGAPLRAVAQYRCADRASLQAAIEHYLAEHRHPQPAAAAIGIANPITGDLVRMTNHHWSFSIAALKKALGVSQLAVVNDFTALALSLPDLAAADLVALGGGPGDPAAARGVIGPGTGLGVSGLLPLPGGGAAAITGEGGHVTLAACDADEEAVIAQLRRRFGHVSAERVLSGPGLVNLHTACAELAGRTPRFTDPADVLTQAADDADCARAVDLFCAFLGSAAGNLALTLGARGGVYIGGGIAPRLLDRLAGPTFRARFEGKGRFRDYLAEVPTWVIRADVSPALLGASRALDGSP
jgi:glucokinase